MKPETILQNQIRCELSKYGVVVRMNSGVFLTPDGRPVKSGIPGIPDLLFIGNGGITVWIEVKTDTGTASHEQKNFIEMLRAHGHRVGIARSVEDALEIINGEARNGEV